MIMKRAIIVALVLVCVAPALLASEASEANGTGVSSSRIGGSLLELYGRMQQGTVVLWPFAVSVVLLIAATAASSRVMRTVGLAIFAVATGGLVIAFAVRWAISARPWYLPPIMNQFGAVMASAMLAAAAALVLEAVYRRNYFAIAAGLYASVATLAGMMFPGAMGAQTSVTHGILESPIMAAHVAVIIIGHAMAGMTLVISVVYLVVAGVAVARGTPPESSPADLSEPAAGGAMAAIDRCNLIVAQIAVWTIVVGTMLGAYWADHAWGRWWGWDPKETWALMTALVYVVVLHIRFVAPPRYRGVLTSAGCIFGCFAMLFNWIVVNYFLVGLHSYA